jgi:UDP-N-acetylmuramoyl-tripeptide--D-alanyl-D-alanine ligase
VGAQQLKNSFLEIEASFYVIMVIMFKLLIRMKLEGYVKRYFKKHPEVKLVVVTGSVGKTSTKVAIATVLNERFRVRLHEGNHNAELSAPLAILGIEYPKSLKSIKAWREVFTAAKLRIIQPTDIDVIVQEVGSDRIGQVPHFGKYTRPDIAVVTAVSPEHMEFFKTIDAVAAEELAAANFSEIALINRDDIDGKYAADLTNSHINTYGTSGNAEYHFLEEDYSIENGYVGSFVALEWEESLKVTIHALGEHNLRPAIAAGAVGIKLGMNAQEIKKGLEKIKAVPGRMNVLRGAQKAIIIDDTYNSSPLAVSSALKTLYQLSVPQKIAVLGSMNELGDSSAAEHEAVGMMCDPDQLAWVVTVGEEAKKYLAPAAKSRGCQVKSFKTALQAGAFVHKVLEPGAAILFKGSEGGIYLEEAIKIVLHSTEDENKLVRQSDTWLIRKNKFFQQFS